MDRTKEQTALIDSLRKKGFKPVKYYIEDGRRQYYFKDEDLLYYLDNNVSYTISNSGMHKVTVYEAVRDLFFTGASLSEALLKAVNSIYPVARG